MKWIVIILVVCALVGGGLFGAKKLGLPPFAKSAKGKQSAKEKAAHSAKPKEGAPAEAAPNADPPHGQRADATNAVVKAEQSQLEPAAGGATSAKQADAHLKAPTGTISTDTIAKDTVDDKSVARLALVYEQMPASGAAEIILKLPSNLQLRLLGKMDEQKVSKLLLSVPADKASELTMAMARSAVAP